MRRQQTTAEYLHSFLPTGFQLRMGEHMTIPAFAELLFDFMYEVEAERFGKEGIAEEPNACRVRDYTDRLAWRIGGREYERWEDAEEELRLRVEDDIEECQEADRPRHSSGLRGGRKPVRPTDIDWDEAARKAYHEMELQEDRDHFQRILGVSDFETLRHDRMWRKHPSMAFASLLRHMVMAACRHEFITRNIPVDALDDCRYDVMSRTEELACDVCNSHWGRYGSPDELNAAIIAIAKAVAEKCGREEK